MGAKYWDGKRWLEVGSGERGPKGDTGNGISSVVQNADYTLTINYTNGGSFTTPNSVRGVPGAQGEPGTSVSEASIDSSGHLIITTSDGMIFDAGVVRIPDSFTWDLIWENSSPGSAFAAQTLHLELSRYDAVAIVFFGQSAGTHGSDITVGYVGASDPWNRAQLFTGVSTTNNRNAKRYAILSDNSIEFTTASYNGETSNGYCIPYRIYGVTGVLGSEVYPGPYTADPSAHSAITLETRDMLMRDDVTVNKIYSAEVSNPEGGNTFYIASDTD